MMLAAYVEVSALEIVCGFTQAFGSGWYVTGLLTPGRAETSTLTASGLAGGFL